MKMSFEKKRRKTPGHYPMSNVEKRSKNYSKARCDGCGSLIRIRHLIYFKGKWLCRSCRNKLDTFKAQSSASNYLTNANCKTIEEVLDKVYEVKDYTNKKGYRKGYLTSFPKCMIGKKFKIILVENE